MISWQSLVGGVEISVEEAAHTLHAFGRPGGWPASGFKSALIHTINVADITNKQKLAGAYPGYVAAVVLAQATEHGVDRLAAIVRKATEAEV